MTWRASSTRRHPRTTQHAGALTASSTLALGAIASSRHARTVTVDERKPMPGPMSAPNGDRKLTQNGEARRAAEAKKQLRTGKTDKKRGPKK